MSGTIFSICSIPAFSAQQAPPKRCRKECNKEQERIVPKSKPSMNLVSRCAASSPTAPSSSTPSRPGILRAPSTQGSNLTAQCAGEPATGGSNQNDAASTSQMCLRDAKMSERARKLAAADTNQDKRFQERAGKLAAENFEVNDEDDSKWPHNLRISHANVPHLEKVCSNCDNNSNASQKTIWEISM